MQQYNQRQNREGHRFEQSEEDNMENQIKMNLQHITSNIENSRKQLAIILQDDNIDEQIRRRLTNANDKMAQYLTEQLYRLTEFNMLQKFELQKYDEYKKNQVSREKEDMRIIQICKQQIGRLEIRILQLTEQLNQLKHKDQGHQEEHRIQKSAQSRAMDIFEQLSLQEQLEDKNFKNDILQQDLYNYRIQLEVHAKRMEELEIINKRLFKEIEERLSRSNITSLGLYFNKRYSFYGKDINAQQEHPLKNKFQSVITEEMDFENLSVSFQNVLKQDILKCSHNDLNILSTAIKLLVLNGRYFDYKLIVTCCKMYFVDGSKCTIKQEINRKDISSIEKLQNKCFMVLNTKKKEYLIMTSIRSIVSNILNCKIIQPTVRAGYPQLSSPFFAVYQYARFYSKVELQESILGGMGKRWRPCVLIVISIGILFVESDNFLTKSDFINGFICLLPRCPQWRFTAEDTLLKIAYDNGWVKEHRIKLKSVWLKNQLINALY